MSDTEPTPGPCTVYLANRINPDTIVEADNEELLVHVVESDNMDADAHLIAAAFNAAHEAREWEMGADPIGMIEEAPDMLLALDRITYALLNDSAITQGDDEEYLRQVKEKIDALQKAERST